MKSAMGFSPCGRLRWLKDFFRSLFGHAALLLRWLQRLQIRDDSLRIRLRVPILRHGRTWGQPVRTDSRHEKSDGRILFPPGKACDIYRFFCPYWHRHSGLEIESRSLQPLLLHEFTLLVARRVTVTAHPNALHQILTSGDPRGAGRMRFLLSSEHRGQAHHGGSYSEKCLLQSD